MEALRKNRVRSLETKNGVPVYEIRQNESFFDTVYIQVVRFFEEYCLCKIPFTQIVLVDLQFNKDGIRIYLGVDNGNIR